MNDKGHFPPLLRPAIHWALGAVALTAMMWVSAWLFTEEKVMPLFITLAVVTGLMAFILPIIGFLFLPVLVGSFFYMGYSRDHHWESLSLALYEPVQLHSLDSWDSLPLLPLIQMPEGAHKNLKPFTHVEEYDNMDTASLSGHGVKLADHYYVPLGKPAPGKAHQRFILKIEVNSVSASFQDQLEAIQSGNSRLATRTAPSRADTFFLKKWKRTPGQAFAAPEVVFLRWGDPEAEVKRLQGRKWKVFAIAHAAWLLLLILHYYKSSDESPQN